MAKFNLTEAAREVLDASVASKRGGQDKTKKLDTSIVSGMKDEGDIGHSPQEKDDPLPDYTKGVPSATPPGATPPVGSEKDGVGITKNTGPQETEGRKDLVTTVQEPATSYDQIRDRVKARLAKQTMTPNPGAHFDSYSEETEVDEDETTLDEHMQALLSGENLSEEFKEKATTIFEAAVVARSEAILEQIEEKLEEEFVEVIEAIKEEYAQKLQDYVDYFAEEWINENQIAIDHGIRTELAEDFMSKLRDLMIESHIDIPEDRVDVVEEMANKIEELEDRLNEQFKVNMEYANELKEHFKSETIATVSEGLTQTQVEKMKALAEGVTFTTVDEFEEKMVTLRESYFPSQRVASTVTDLNEEIEFVEEPKKTTKDEMDVYASVIARTIPK